MTKTEIIADHGGEMTETDTMTEGMDREGIGATKVTRGEEERGVAIDGTMMAPSIGGRDRDEIIHSERADIKTGGERFLPCHFGAVHWRGGTPS